MATKRESLTKQQYRLNEITSYQKKIKTGDTIIGYLQADERGELFLTDYPQNKVEIATSCLVEPLSGDRINAIFDGVKWYVTAILDRPKTQQEIALNFKKNNLSISANNIYFKVSNNLNLQTGNYTIDANRTEWNSCISKYIYNKVYVVAENAYNNVIENSEIHSNNLFIKIKQACTIKSSIGIIKSDAILKIDGGQVHMG